MLLWLTNLLAHHFHGFRVFQYLTLRSIIAALSALIIALWSGPKLIQKLSSKQIGQVIRGDGPSGHLKKEGTPTMGGALILFAITVSMLLWGDLDNRYTWLVLLTTLAFGLIGGVDDYLKITRRNSKGLKSRWKFFWQSFVALVVLVVMYKTAVVPAQLQLIIPFLKNVTPHLGIFFIVLGYFVIVGSSNAVNLTDGLDGLALMPTVMVAAGLGVFAYLTGNHLFSRYLAIPYIPGVGEVCVFCGAIVGAGLGFLWYNTYPAQVFMGDVGSLGLGAALGVIAVVVRQELVLLIMGGVFVIETLSVILQVASFKLTGRRIFKMAPLHHHFELKGWPEPRVIVRFWIISLILVLLGLATLKLR